MAPRDDVRPRPDQPTGRAFVGTATFLAVLLAAAAFWLAEEVLGWDLRLGVTLLTALIVGGFAALILLRPSKPEGDGFVVEKKRVREIPDVPESEDDDRDQGPGPTLTGARKEAPEGETRPSARDEAAESRPLRRETQEGTGPGRAEKQDEAPAPRGGEPEEAAEAGRAGGSAGAHRTGRSGTRQRGGRVGPAAAPRRGEGEKPAPDAGRDQETRADGPSGGDREAGRDGPGDGDPEAAADGPSGGDQDTRTEGTAPRRRKEPRD